MAKSKMHKSLFIDVREMGWPDHNEGSSLPPEGDVQSCAEHLLPPVRKQRLSSQPSTSISFYKL